MALLALFARERRIELRLTDLLEPRHAVALSHSWGGLNRILRERPVTGTIINLAAVPTYPSPERIIAAQRALFPHLGLVLLLPKDQDPFTLFRLGRAGVKNLVLLPEEDARHGIERALAEAGRIGASSFVARALSRFLPRRELGIVRLAMDSVHLRWTAEDLAEEVCLTRPYLSECLKKAGLPSLGHFLLWTKLFHAGHWLEEPGRTGESVGRQLEYSSGAAFRRALKLYTGATPTEVRTGGGIRLVFDHFLHRSGLSRARAGSTGSLSPPAGHLRTPSG